MDSQAVGRLQSYLQQHMEQTVTLKQLADVVGYSPYYVTRMFKAYTGKTPFEYLRCLRLTQAALRLRDRQDKVLDVALDYVFDSHEGFTRAFAKEFGICPKKYSQNPPPIKLFMPYPAREERKEHQTDTGGKRIMNTVFVQVIERPARKLMLKRGINASDYFAYCQEVGCQTWGVLCSVKQALYEPVGMWLPQGMISPGTSTYAQGVEVPADYGGVVPPGFDLLTLAPTKMMVFQGPRYENEEEDFEQAIAELQQAMADFDPGLYGFEWADEMAPRFQMEPQGYRGYIEARPVRQTS